MTDAEGSMGPSKRAVHGGQDRPGPGGPVVFPVHPSATFYLDPVPTGEVRYTRYGTNPNHEAVARKLAVLEQAEAALVLSSGNAAMSLALLVCVQSGDCVLAVRALYGGTLRMPDVAAAAAAARDVGAPLIVDAMFAAGRADLVAGVHELLRSFGPVLDPHATLEAHPAVRAVFYPGLPSHADHARAQALPSGFGGVVSAVVRAGDDAALGVLQRLKLIRNVPSPGGVDSQASMRRYTSHASLDRAPRHALGIGDGFVRLAFGSEDGDALIADLDQALATLART